MKDPWLSIWLNYVIHMAIAAFAASKMTDEEIDIFFKECREKFKSENSEETLVKIEKYLKESISKFRELPHDPN